MTEQFKVGDTVTWTSQAGGKSKTKTGQVFAVVPPMFAAESCSAGLKVRMRTGKDTALNPRRSHESYLVKVDGESRLYWPLVKNLKRVESQIVTIPEEMPEENETLQISKVNENSYEMEWRKADA